jgi:tRNA(adenine34) deaminase
MSVNSAESSAKVLLAYDKIISAYEPRSEYPHDCFILPALRQALLAAKKGDFGVGAVLVNDKGKIILEARNRMFNPYFRSDRHAEMILLNCFEKRRERPEGHAVFVSLEPCPMCITRLLISGIPSVYFAAPNETGGMVTRITTLPPTWRAYLKGKRVEQAQCAPQLTELAWKIFRVTADRNFERVMKVVRT